MTLAVVQVVPALHSGGVERGTLEVAKGLVDRGHRSIVISGGGRLVEQLEREGSEHFTWAIGRKSPWTLRFISQLRRFLHEHKVDVLHARSRVPAWIAYLAWRGMKPKARTRFVTTMHGLHTVNWYSAIMTKGERVIAVSETIRQHILENYPSPGLEERIRVIHRGVDPQDFPRGYQPTTDWMADWNSRHPQLQGKRILTLPGRITRLKGHVEFIDLVAQVNQMGLDCVGLVVGDEDPKRRGYAREIRKLAEQRMPGSIIFTGHHSDMRDIYAVSDIVLALSQQPESFGRTVLEALSIGTPVVGYDHGGVGEILAELLPEGRIPSRDVKQAAKTVAQFLSQPPEVRQNDWFRLKTMIEQTLAVYAEVMVGKAANNIRIIDT